MTKVTIIFKIATNGMSFYSREDRLVVQGKITDAKRSAQGALVLRSSNGSVFIDPREVIGVLFEED